VEGQGFKMEEEEEEEEEEGQTTGESIYGRIGLHSHGAGRDP
jgi:hypothetical protein